MFFKKKKWIKPCFAGYCYSEHLQMNVFQFACAHNHPEVAKIFLKNSVVTSKDLKFLYGDRLSPLHHACINGYINVVKAIFDVCYEDNIEINVNIRDNSGSTPLHDACFHGHFRLVQLLMTHPISKGILDIQAQDQNGQTPMHHAALKGHSKIFDALSEYAKENGDIDVNIPDISGMTPEQCAEYHKIAKQEKKEEAKIRKAKRKRSYVKFLMGFQKYNKKLKK